MSAFERITVEVSTEVADAMRRSVDEGEYESTDRIVDDVLYEWIRARETSESDLERLRRLIDEGDASGPGIPAEEAFAEIETLIASYEKAG